uniref:Uncharacterized protein n=1 Tax=Arundo donax TaxID=35708 RepID=A0A0A9HKZ8_ARUDO
MLKLGLVISDCAADKESVLVTEPLHLCEDILKNILYLVINRYSPQLMHVFLSYQCF